MKIRIKSILAYILMVTILMGNTVSASATGVYMGQDTNGQKSVSQIEELTADFDGTDVITEEEAVAREESSIGEGITREEGSSIEEGPTVEEGSSIEEETTVEDDSSIEEGATIEEGSSIEEGTIIEEDSGVEEETTAIEGDTEEETTAGEDFTTEDAVEETGTEPAETITEIEETLEAIDVLGENVGEQLVSLLGADEQNGQFLIVDSYGTLQEALNAIEGLNEPQKYYRIELESAQEDVITSGNSTLVFPEKTAGLTIVADNQLAEPFVFFKGNITLKSNIKFEDIIFVPASKAAISLGKYSLTLSRCYVDESKGGGFGAVSGSGVNGQSQLILEDTNLRVLGAVNKVGSIVFTKENIADATPVQAGNAVRLLAEGKINVGSIILETDGILTGIATVTRKNGKLTKVVPQITIAGDVISNTENVLYLDLQEKVAGAYMQLDLDKEEAKDIQRGGIYFAKADRVSYPHIKALQRNEEDNLVKIAGYLTYLAEQYGAKLSFIEEGMEKVIPCKTFADAVAEINNRKTKRDYVITLTKDCAVVTGVRQDVLEVVPKALTMPNKKYISSLVIQADPTLETEKTVQLGFTGNLTFTSDVTLCNVELVQMVKKGTSYLPANVAKDDYPTAVTVKTGGFALAIVGEVTINTPVLLNGGNKGSLVFERGSTFTTLTNDQEKTLSDRNNTILGAITGFDKVIVNGCELNVSEYQTARNGSYKASANTISNLELVDAKLAVVGENTNAALTVKNLYVDNAEIYVGGKINITNATLEGTQKATIFADREFVISGKLTSNSNNATLLTRLRGKGKAPYLTINGNVVRGEGVKPVYVGVYHWDTASEAIRNEAVVLANAPKVSAQLLTAKKASAVDFRPLSENYGAGSGEYHKDNTSGYMMMKSGSNIYVYEGSKVKIAVYVKYMQDADGNGELFGFFPTMKEATTAVNAKKDRAAYYTYVLMERNGTVATPITISLPSYAKEVTITSIPDCNVDMKTITFSGKVTLGTDTVFKNVIFAPVSKAKGAAFSIATGANDLTLEEVSISNQLGKSALKNISGNGKQSIVLDSTGLQLAGSVTNVASLVVKENTRINGSVKATLLRLENNSEGEAVTLDAKGSVSITNLENAGALPNTLCYTRTSENITNLTIDGYIYNESSEQPVILKQDEQKKITAVYQNGVKTVLSTAAIAAVMPKASTDSFVLDAVVTDRDGEAYADISSLQMVKAKKGIYLADISDEEMLSSGVNLISERGNERTVTYCLDYTQAVKEINNRADKQAEYTICFVAEGEEWIDLNLTDAKKYSAFSMPKKNTKASLIIKATGTESVCVPFTGNITAYGNVTLQNLVLKPVKTDSSDAPVNVKLITNADATGALVKLDKVVTEEQLLGKQRTLGYISDIKGTKNKTELVVQNCEEIYFALGISSVKSVSLKESRILSAKNSTITNLELDKTSAWIALGKFSVTNVNIPEGVIHSYVGVKQNLMERPQLTISGGVNSGTLLVRLFEADTALADGFELFETTTDKEIESYLNVSLALAPKADVSDIRAYAYRMIDETGTVAANADGVGQDNFASYKDEDYVKNGTQDSVFLMYGSKELNASAKEAGEELVQTAQEKPLYALVYMTDSYDIKETANEQSATVATLQSGHTVQVIGMDAEWTYSSEWEEYIPTVWYYVQFYIGETIYKGYVKESFLAYSDEMLLQWKNDWYMLFPLDRSLYAAGAMNYSDVNQFPSDYRVHLKKLKDAHPNWIFVPMNVGRVWDACVNEQMGNYSWIYYNQPAEFRASKINDQINDPWYYASRAGIEYYMDPRNFLTESDIFQFEQNTYNASYHTQSALQSFLNNTFMSGKVQGDSQGRTYAYVIWNSGKTRGLSPFNLAARVIQEQGVKGASSMISGTYSGYEGYYNHYNIQASGTTDAEVIRNGLAYAKKMGWNTRVKSLDGGAAFIGMDIF